MSKNQVSPWHNKVHLNRKLTLARTLGDQFKSGSGKGGLFHLHITIQAGLGMTYAKIPKLKLLNTGIRISKSARGLNKAASTTASELPQLLMEFKFLRALKGLPLF